MRKILIETFVITLCFFGFANAQGTGGRFGIKGGINFPNSSSDFDENETLIGYQFGVF